MLTVWLVGLTRSPLPLGGALNLLPRNPPDQGPAQVAVPNLEAGACVALQPTARGSGKTVFIDPGHGGPDSGVVGVAGGGQVQEKDATLAVATRLGTLLRADGYRVVLSRTRDTSVVRLASSEVDGGLETPEGVRHDLETRIACANASGASMLVSIHFDGFSDPSVGGTETFYDAQRPFAASSKRLAGDLQASLVSGLGSTDRGVWTDDQMVGPALTAAGAAYGHLILLGPQSTGFVDQPSAMPGALVEPLFVTDSSDAAVLVDPRGQQRIAQAIEAGVTEYFAGS